MALLHTRFFELDRPQFRRRQSVLTRNTNITPVSFDCTVGIVDYGLGNTQSIANALNVLGAKSVVTKNTTELATMDALILPGVGAFETGMNNLTASGLIPVLEELVMEQQKPVLGICLGMHLLALSGTEGNITTKGLGWIPAQVKRLEACSNSTIKVPHVGWNDVHINQSSQLLGTSGVPLSYYFIHSYYVDCQDAAWASGYCYYGQKFPVVLEHKNIMAVQFHPEKSQKTGLSLLKRFLESGRRPSIPPQKLEGFSDAAP